MSEFPVFRLKSFKHYGPKGARREGANFISADFKLRDPRKHLVVMALGLVDGATEIPDEWIERAVAACAEAWRPKEAKKP